MKKLTMIILLALLTGCGFTNPSVPTETVGYVTNEPFMFGNKGEFLDIVIGPGSYGIGWRNEIKKQYSYTPWTQTEHFSPKNGAGSGKNEDERLSDTRITSKDKINMEVEVDIIRGFKYSPLSGSFDKPKFKLNIRKFFEGYQTAWSNRFRKDFRAQVRKVLKDVTFEQAVENRELYSGKLKTYLSKVFTEADAPYYVISVQISNINPPDRIAQEMELKKAVQISTERQILEARLQKSKEDVITQEALNLKKALSISSRYLESKALLIQEIYAEGYNTLIKSKNNGINKTIFIPFGTPIGASINVGGKR